MTFETSTDAANAYEVGLRAGKTISMGEFDMDSIQNLTKQSEILVEMAFFVISLGGGLILANRHEDPINLYFVLVSISMVYLGFYLFKIYFDPAFWTCNVLCLFWYIQSTLAFAINEWYIAKFDAEGGGGGLLVASTSLSWTVGIILCVCATIFAVRPTIIVHPYSVTIAVIIQTLLIMGMPMIYSNALHSLLRTGMRLSLYLILYVTLANKYKTYVVRILRDRVNPPHGNYGHRLSEYTAMVIRRLAIIPEIAYVLYAPIMLVVFLFVCHVFFNVVIMQKYVIDTAKKDFRMGDGPESSVVAPAAPIATAETNKPTTDSGEVNSFLNNFSKSTLRDIISEIE